MAAQNQKYARQVAALVARTLIVDPNQHAARLLGDSLRSVALGEIAYAKTADRGLVFASQLNPTIIFVEHVSCGVDGAGLMRAVRRSVLDCRTAPAIMVTAEATAAAIHSARDAGIHEFMRKPFALADLLRRLEVVASQPRDWVESMGYIGPDRRRFNSEAYAGQRRRKLDDTGEEEGRIIRALKIIHLAAQAVDQDPFQARRALHAQALALQRAGYIMNDKAVSEAAAKLEKLTAHDGESLVAKTIEEIVAALMSRVPKDDRGPGGQIES